jgi:hypothetical protein
MKIFGIMEMKIIKIFKIIFKKKRNKYEILYFKFFPLVEYKNNKF